MSKMDNYSYLSDFELEYVDKYRRNLGLLFSAFSFFVLVILSYCAYWYDDVKDNHIEYKVVLICLCSNFVLYSFMMFAGFIYMCCFSYKWAVRVGWIAFGLGFPSYITGIILLIVGYRDHYDWIDKHLFRAIGYCSFGYIYFPVIYMFCRWWLRCKEKEITDNIYPLDFDHFYNDDISSKSSKRSSQSDRSDGYAEQQERSGYETDLSDNGN